MKAFVGLVLLLSCLAVTQARHGSHEHKEKSKTKSDVNEKEKRPEDNIDIFSPPRPPPGLRPTGFEVVPNESSAPPELPSTGLPRPDEQSKKILVEPGLTGGPHIQPYPFPEPLLPYPGPIPEPLPPFPRPFPEPLPPFPEPRPAQPFSNCKEAPRLYGMRQIDAGFGMVVATTNQNRAFFLSGQGWNPLGSYRSTFSHVSVGPAGIWAVGNGSTVYNYMAGDFRSTPWIYMSQVDAGGDGQVVGITSSSYTEQCLRISPAMAYNEVPRPDMARYLVTRRYQSCGPYSCWIVDQMSHVYVSKRIGSRSCKFGAGIQVPGISARMIEVGTDGSVYALATNGVVYQRTGVHKGRPQGHSWIKVPMCMPVQHITYDVGQLWILTKSGLLLQCSRPNKPVFRPRRKEFLERVRKME